MASHELKTPLTVITSSLSMMRNEGIDSRYLGYAEDEAERMRKLVLQLLDLSKLEHQRQPFEVFDMSEAVESIVLPFESLAYEQDIDLSYDIEESIRVKGIRQEIEQLTAILTENAVRHTAPEQKVRVSLQRSGGSCLLEVKNQGQEILQEEREKIFDKFYQAAGSEDYPESVHEGNYGLGLAIAQTVASRHFSKIKVRCEGGWNIFSIRLPAQS
jgi:signal transduction histidine kinase